jgi:glycosyltransferase involved in cell wall biosynthesis
MTDWHARIQRTQQLALGLAAVGHRCYYVNPHLGFQFPRVYFRDRRHRLSFLARRVIELHLRVLREPVVHHRLPTSRECRTLGDAVGLLVRAADVRKLVQIVSLPFWLDVATRLRQAHGFPIIYDCHDLLGAFRGVKREVVGCEADLFRLCDLVVFSSQQLMDVQTAEFPYLRGKSLLVRNAADAAGVAGGEAVRRARCPGGPAKVIGYIGALDDWFDVEAVRVAAHRQPGWQFVLIGRIETHSVLALKELPNVKFLGELPHSELRAHLADFDVGLIPFLRNELTLAANPIKLYEYLSYGLPVVSSRLPEVEMLGDLVYIADGPEDFADKVEAAANEGDSSIGQRRRAAVLRETWPDRVRQFQAAFGRLLDPARPDVA